MDGTLQQYADMNFNQVVRINLEIIKIKYSVYSRLFIWVRKSRKRDSGKSDERRDYDYRKIEPSLKMINQTFH